MWILRTSKFLVRVTDDCVVTAVPTIAGPLGWQCGHSEVRLLQHYFWGLKLCETGCAKLFKEGSSDDNSGVRARLPLGQKRQVEGAKTHSAIYFYVCVVLFDYDEELQYSPRFE